MYVLLVPKKHSQCKLVIVIIHMKIVFSLIIVPPVFNYMFIKNILSSVYLIVTIYHFRHLKTLNIASRKGLSIPSETMLEYPCPFVCYYYNGIQ